MPGRHGPSRASRRGAAGAGIHALANPAPGPPPGRAPGPTLPGDALSAAPHLLPESVAAEGDAGPPEGDRLSAPDSVSWVNVPDGRGGRTHHCRASPVRGDHRTKEVAAHGNTDHRETRCRGGARRLCAPGPGRRGPRRTAGPTRAAAAAERQAATSRGRFSAGPRYPGGYDLRPYPYPEYPRSDYSLPEPSAVREGAG